MEARRQAEELVAYYANCDIQFQFAKDWWIRGLETAQEWLRLTTSASVSQHEVSSLLATAKANQHNGSGWGLMALLMYSWAKQSGLGADGFAYVLLGKTDWARGSTSGRLPRLGTASAISAEVVVEEHAQRSSEKVQEAAFTLASRLTSAIR